MESVVLSEDLVAAEAVGSPIVLVVRVRVVLDFLTLVVL